MITTILIILFLCTNGSININKYYFRWVNIFHSIMFPGFSWIWIGTREEYIKLLEKESKKLKEE